MGHLELDISHLVEPLYPPTDLYSLADSPAEKESNVSTHLISENSGLLSKRHNANDVLRVLGETSRTFYIPITRLPGELKETAAAAYLCLRALDEIEDHPKLHKAGKVKLLDDAYLILLRQRTDADTHLGFETIFRPYQTELPEVTLRIDEWLSHPPKSIRSLIRYYTMVMADHMLYWVKRNWEIQNESDLDRYTFDVAGVVGLLLGEIWFWHANTNINSTFSIQYGQSLQAVNILRNREEDLQRKVDFYPHGWGQEQMLTYANKKLNQVKEKVNSIPQDAFTHLFEIPLALAEATLYALENGKTKLTRGQVQQIINRLDEKKK
jgi:farnesyl-diphosphate farnesyltransferase